MLNLDGHPHLSEESEQAALLRATKLVEHLYRVPIAYIALLESNATVRWRVGSGSQYWASLSTFPLAKPLVTPVVWPDVNGDTIPGFIPGEVRFAASAPLRAIDGLEFGVLVIADVTPRPEFTESDLKTLEELAAMLAGKMELRLIAGQAREMALRVEEAEGRFRHIANAAPVMIICADVAGGCSFVNKAWLEFTGRELAEELGDGYADTFHPDYREMVVQTYWKAFRERKPISIEFLMRRPNGAYHWVRANGAPRFLDNREYAGFIACFVDLGSEASFANARDEVMAGNDLRR